MAGLRFNADFRRAKSAHILHRHPQCFSRILLLFVSGFSSLLSWIVMLLFRYSSRIVETQMLFVLDIVARAACVQPWSCGQVCEIALLNSRV
jgi:hypothetical protein